MALDVGVCMGHVFWMLACAGCGCGLNVIMMMWVWPRCWCTERCRMKSNLPEDWCGCGLDVGICSCGCGLDVGLGCCGCGLDVVYAGVGVA